jgi:AcrR family transcriptional regulator
MKPAKSLSNREALLLGAKKCLLETGYNRTTARDIASAAGVSLAAIGYHFSSKEALLTEALLLAFDEWDQDLQRALQKAVPANVPPAHRFEAVWAEIMATFETHRSLWIANFEIFAQMVGQPEARKVVADKLNVARAGLAAMFLNQDESTISEHTTRTIGTFLHVLLSGLLLQWLIDPANTLSAKALTEAMCATAENLKPERRQSEGQSKGRPGKRKKGNA